MAKTTNASDKVIIRLPDGMRDSLKADAEKNGRTMNAEIVERLEAYPKFLALEPKVNSIIVENSRYQVEIEHIKSEVDKYKKLLRDARTHLSVAKNTRESLEKAMQDKAVQNTVDRLRNRKQDVSGLPAEEILQKVLEEVRYIGAQLALDRERALIAEAIRKDMENGTKED